jgi:acyl dehydratase
VTTRYLEDFAVGQVFEGGALAVLRADIEDFARRFDPLPIHLDGDVNASGTHLMAMRTRLLHDLMGTNPAIVAALGWETVRFITPVRTGDTLSLRVAIESARPSASRPGLGVLTSAITMLNQRGASVLTHGDVILIRRRPA